MKKTRKIAAFAAAMAMAATMAMPMVSSAADPTYTITISDANFTHDDAKAFQIFEGNHETIDGNVMFSVTGWGDGIDVVNFIKALKLDATVGSKFAGITAANTDATAIAVSKKIGELTDKSPEAEAVARLAVNYRSGSGSALTDLPAGYYVVVDTAAAKTSDGVEAYSLGMLKVTSDTSLAVSAKIAAPTFTKKINDINDSTDDAYVYGTDKEYTSGGTWGDDADHDMGDEVPFRLGATFPSNYDKYTTYKMIFHDDIQEDVFALNTDSIRVYYVAGTTKTELVKGTDYTVDTTTATSTDAQFKNGHTDGKTDLLVTLADIKSVPETRIPATPAAGAEIVVEYTATLTTDANVGDAGNWNSAYLEYSNNPNYRGDGEDTTTPDTPADDKPDTPSEEDTTDKTPEQYVVDFTYQTVINKIDGTTGDPLEGAEFTLVKTLKDGTTKSYTITKDATGTKFTAVGLDDGIYTLTESKVPANYKGIAPIVIEVNAEHGSKTLTTLTALDSENVEFGTITLSEGKIESNVENKTGTTLPSTGGMGTRLFVLGGGCMAGLAGLYLVSKKRSKDAE